MSGENNKKQGSFGFPAAYLGAIVITVGAFTIGLKLCPQLSNGRLLTFLCLGILVLCVILSPVASALFRKRVQARNVRESNARADERLERMARDPGKEWRKLLMLCHLAAAYVGLLWALCIAVPFFYGTSGLSTDWIFLVTIPLFFVSGLIGKLIKPKEQDAQSEPLPEKDFPKLYSLARQAGGEDLAGRKLTIRVLHGIPDEECNAALAISEKEICIWLGAVLLCVLDEGELKQVILHEFAHMDKGDASQNRVYNRIMGYLTADGKSVFEGINQLALSFAIDILQQEGSFYFWLSSREKERRADGRAASLGDQEKQCSALAKIGAHTLYAYEQFPYDNLFVSEQIPRHLMTDRARAFRDALRKREGDWRMILEHGLPSRIDTHPTFRQRWEDLGCCAYSMLPADAGSEFAKECWAAAETADAERASISQADYDQMRKEGYLDPCAVIEAYESRDRELSPDELREPMLAYYKIGKPEKMEAICDKILAESDSPFSTAFARYWKGYLLLHRYDRAGLDFIYGAMEANSNYIQSGLNEIGSFCTMMGLEAELHEYRSRAPELMQLKVDRTVGGIHPKARLEPAVLPDGWQEKILEFILSVGKEELEEVYLVRELASDDYTPSSFVLRFGEATPEDRVNQIYDRVFSLLDDWPEDYEFALYVYEEGMEKALSKVNGSCLYRRGA